MSRRRPWNRCACGCRERISRFANFVPGHDQKLRAKLEVQMGGLLPLKALVEAHLAKASAKEVTAS